MYALIFLEKFVKFMHIYCDQKNNLLLSPVMALVVPALPKQE